MKKTRPIFVCQEGELAVQSTRQLLARLQRLRECENSLATSDHPEKGPEPGTIEFREQTEWRQAYQQVKKILAQREHVPKGSALVKRRMMRAKQNKSAERRAGRNRHA